MDSSDTKENGQGANGDSIVPTLPDISISSQYPRGTLFKLCDGHTQRAIVQLREALECLGASSSRKSRMQPSADRAQYHVAQATEILLASGSRELSNSRSFSQFSDSFHKGMEEVSVGLSTEVSEWLSAAYSPRHPRALKFENHGAINRQMSTEFRLESHVNPAVRELLEHALSWEKFDIFSLNTFTNGHPLVTLAMNLFHRFDLFEQLQLDTNKVRQFWQQVESGYRDLPYHNATHAADVMQAIAWMLETPTVRQRLSPIETCAALVAAGIHDHDHPGVNNDFLIKTQHELALRYNDRSVLEHHHASSGLAILAEDEKFNFLSHLDAPSMRNFRELVIAMVLATDMSSHFRLQTEFGLKFDESAPEDAQGHQLLLQQLVHAADISNCGRPFEYAEKWGEKIMEEFWNQGDRERQLMLPVQPINNRDISKVEKSQIGFIQHIVKPMFEVMVPVVPETKLCLQHANTNIARWHTRMVGASMRKEGIGSA